MKIEPIAKHAGGKRAQAQQILTHAPPSIGRYIEAFVGGGAVFCALRNAGYDGPAILCDLNPEIINAYRVVRDHPDDLVAALRKHVNTREHFDLVAALRPKSLLSIDRAARFLFLNKTCYSGLWRVNKRGEFNVPFGGYSAPDFVNEKGLRAFGAALKGVQMECVSFEALDAAVRPGDWVYCDSPYAGEGSFRAYTSAGFPDSQQVVLRDLALAWSARDAKVVLSNADVPEVRGWYAEGFDLIPVQSNRNINSDASDRGPVGELLIVAHPRSKL